MADLTYGSGLYGGGTYGTTAVVDPPGGPGTGERDAGEAVVATSGDVYVAPVGTALPIAARSPLHPLFYRVGLVSEDGVSLAWAPEVEDLEGWQEHHPIRRELRQQRIAVTFDMLQWNAENVVWAFGGNGSISEYAPNSWRYDFPADGGDIDERSVVIDWSDQDRLFRLVFARGTVLGGLSTTLRRAEMALLPVGFDVLAVDDGGNPGYLFLSGQPAPPPSGDSPEFGEGTFGDGTFG